MRKGEKTKLHIIMKSAELFNQKGYTATSMQDIIDATGLTKGALYRGFASKDEIALEAFKYAGEVLWGHFSAAIEGKTTATEKIIAMGSVYSDAVNNPPMQGGCPFLNTAVESVRSYPALREPAAQAYGGMLAFMRGVLEHGKAAGEFRDDMDTEAIASFVFSAVEGAIMASRLNEDNRHVAYALDNIERLLNSFKR